MLGPLVALALAAGTATGEPPAAPPGPPALADLVARARALGLATDRGWLRLGHWRPRPFGGWKSEVDGKEFFLAREGKTDPAAELEATLAGLLDPAEPPEELDRPRCRFPARLAFLSGRLGFDPARLPPHACPRLADFLSRVEPRGVTLVFSSYYLDNPASAFGHTLLRLDRAPEALGGKHFELLDYGVDYAATVDTSNALLYGFKGLFGLFRGEFKHYAYYYKVREYADYESRDLWEYDLDLTPDEVALLTAHLWELGGTWFQYWYLDENCSYHVLGALEAAAPRLELLRHAGKLVVLPSDTVKALFRNPGLVKRVHYRPSVRTQLEARVAALPPGGLDATLALAHDPATPLDPALGQAGAAAVLDAAVDLVDLRHGRALLRGTDPAAARLRQDLLERRAELPVASPPLDLSAPDERRPERGHGSLRLGVGGGADRDLGGTVLLDFRLALHDLGDRPDGYPPDAALEFLPARLRWLPGEHRLELDDASLVRIRSLNPVSGLDLRPSWGLRVGATTIRDAGCPGCLAFAADLGGGFTVGLGRALELLGTADAEVEAAPGLAGAGGSGWRPGLGPSGLARLRLGDLATLLADARWRVLPGASPRTTWALAADLRLSLGRDLALSLEARHTPLTTDAGAVVLGYF